MVVKTIVAIYALTIRVVIMLELTAQTVTLWLHALSIPLMDVSTNRLPLAVQAHVLVLPTTVAQMIVVFLVPKDVKMATKPKSVKYKQMVVWVGL